MTLYQMVKFIYTNTEPNHTRLKSFKKSTKKKTKILKRKCLSESYACKSQHSTHTFCYKAIEN